MKVKAQLTNGDPNGKTLEVLLEGNVYSALTDDLEAALRSVGEALGTPLLAKRIEAFVDGADGEFNVLLVAPSEGRWVFFNDYLGRLPVYTAATGGTTIIGRSLVRVARLANKSELNYTTLATRLVFGHPFDRATEYVGVERIDGGAVITGGSGQKTVITFPNALNLDSLDESSPAQGSQLAESLITAVGARMKSQSGLQPLVALSGGFDSRIVACALTKSVGQIATVTRAKAVGPDPELIVAQDVARALQVQHGSFTLHKIEPDIALETSRLTDGGICLENARMLQFLRQVQSELGSNYLLFTGDGGDNTLGTMTPTTMSTSEHVVSWFTVGLRQDDLWLCKQLTGIGSQQLTEHIRESIALVPERRPSNVLRGLTLRQRNGRWLYLGEERNRGCYWSTTPFFAPAFLKPALAIPDSKKRLYECYFDVLGVLNPECQQLHRAEEDIRDWAYRMRYKGFLHLAKSKHLLALYRGTKHRTSAKKPASPATRLHETLSARYASTEHPLFRRMSRKDRQQWLDRANGSAFMSRFLSLAVALQP